MDKKSKRKISLIMIVVFLVVVMMPAAVFAAKDKAKTINVGFFEFDGYHMMDSNGDRSGYGYEYLQEMAKYNKWKYNYVGYDKSWSDMLAMLEKGELDMLTSGQKTPERLAKFDFSDEAIGVSASILTVKAGNDKFEAGKYETYDGIRIGMLKGNSRNEDLREFASQNGFTYKAVYYEDIMDLIADLQRSKGIDAAVTSNLRGISNEWIIAQFAESPFYVMVKKGNSELLKQVNNSIEQINRFSPSIETDLRDKYYAVENGAEIAYTAEELEYIDKMNAEGRVFSVGLNPDRKPLSFFENGNARGIVADIGREILNRTGLKYEFINVQDRNEYYDGTRNEAYDIRIDSGMEYNASERFGYKLTNGYIETSVSMVVQRNFSGEVKSIASLKRHGYLEDFEDKYYPEAKVKTYDTIFECINAVKRGDVDATFVLSRVAQQYLYDDETNRLIANTIPNSDESIAIGVDNDEDVILMSILNKAVDSIGTEYINNVANEYMSFSDKQYSFISFMYMYPGATIAAIAVVAIMMILAIRLVYTRRKTKFEARQNRIISDALTVAQNASEAKGQFMFKMSHEIRTPLNAVLGYMTLAEEVSGNPKKTVEYIEKSKVSGEHLLGIINDVLDMSSIESGKLKMAKDVFSFEEIIKECETVFGQQAADKGIEFIVTRENDVSSYLIGDKMRINQIPYNLLSNAIKFTAKGGRVEFKSKEVIGSDNVGRLKIQVEDSGIGMSEEYQKKMFTPFEQEDESIARRYGGSGLGLSITYNLVTMMDGTISVDSEPGKGTKFTVMLALDRPSDDAETPKKEESSELGDIAGMHVLLAEDNLMNFEIAKAFLTKKDVIVDDATTGLEAVEKFQQSEPGTYDAIIMDIQMPVMDGYQETEVIRKGEHPEGKTIPIIAMTANAFTEDVSRAISHGLNDHISKPFKANDLVRVLYKYRKK